MISVERLVFLLEVYRCCLSRVAETVRCIPSSIWFGSSCFRCVATSTGFLSILDWILSLDSVPECWMILLSVFSSDFSCWFIGFLRCFDFHLSILECYSLICCWTSYCLGNYLTIKIFNFGSDYLPVIQTKRCLPVLLF